MTLPKPKKKKPTKEKAGFGLPGESNAVRGTGSTREAKLRLERSGRILNALRNQKTVSERSEGWVSVEPPPPAPSASPNFPGEQG